MFGRLTKEDFELIEAFISETQNFSKEEILNKLGLIAGNKYFPGHIELTFAQLEQDIETTIRIPREYLAQKVLNREISDVSLENLETLLPLMTSKKRKVTNIIYEGFFNNFKNQKITKLEQKLIKEAEKRLELFFSFQTTIKEAIEIYINVKKMFVSVKLKSNPEFQTLSFLVKFDELIDEKLKIVSEQVKETTPALKEPNLMDIEKYQQLVDSNMSELENDLARLEQISEWKKAVQNTVEKEYIERIGMKVVALQRMHRGVIFLAYCSIKNIDAKLALLMEQTYALEARIDKFK